MTMMEQIYIQGSPRSAHDINRQVRRSEKNHGLVGIIGIFESLRSLLSVAVALLFAAVGFILLGLGNKLADRWGIVIDPGCDGD